MALHVSSYRQKFIVVILFCLLSLHCLTFGAKISSKKDAHPFRKQDNRRGERDGGQSFTGWVDPDTDERYWTTESWENGETYDLVMSDEFEVDGRTFADGDDPKWCALDKSDDDQTSSGKKSLQYYNSSNVLTKNGKLVIKTTTEDTKWREFNPYKEEYEIMHRQFKSGMLMGWNKFCFTGGILEIDLKFPGLPEVGGLWPAAWLLGNLGRATYESSTNKMWPWSYPKCDREQQQAQELSGCDITEHYDLNQHQGRGATEIDLVEVMPGPPDHLPIVKNNIHRPYGAMTLQMAPGVDPKKKRPESGTLPEWGYEWYNNLTYGRNASINPYFYGTYLGPTKKKEPIYRSIEESYQCDAIGALTQLNKSNWHEFTKFRLEWQPGENGYLRWYANDEFKFGVFGADLKNVSGGGVPNEPSYIILNTAISTSWGFPEPPAGCDEYDCKTATGRCGMNEGFCKSLPAEFQIESIRIYQNRNDSRQYLGCNPPEYPTAKYIKAHEFKYLSTYEYQSMKNVKKGGGKCQVDKPNDCGGSSRGSCGIFGTCSCKTYWTGPYCKVPTYQNDFPDWEADNEWIFQGFMPRVPVFLVVIGFGFVSALILAVSLLMKDQRSRNERGDLNIVPQGTQNMQGTNSYMDSIESNNNLFDMLKERIGTIFRGSSNRYQPIDEESHSRNKQSKGHGGEIALKSALKK